MENIRKTFETDQYDYNTKSNFIKALLWIGGMEIFPKKVLNLEIINVFIGL